MRSDSYRLKIRNKPRKTAYKHVISTSAQRLRDLIHPASTRMHLRPAPYQNMSSRPSAGGSAPSEGLLRAIKYSGPAFTRMHSHPAPYQNMSSRPPAGGSAPSKVPPRAIKYSGPAFTLMHLGNASTKRGERGRKDSWRDFCFY
jgi:hypothetical protein